jgi:hypothetical protein
MITSFPRRVFAVLLFTGLLAILFPYAGEACGPFFTDAIFVYSKHPDFPLEQFAAGKIGVIQPTWARSYLVVAYRSLSGSSLSPNEIAAITALWDDRLNFGGELDDSTWIKKWTDARSKVTGLTAAPEIHAFRNREKPHEYESFLNCQEDAFDNAVATLNERIKTFTADSAQVRDWVATQDLVFSNCGAGRQIPEAARADQDALIRADRAYQIAAANFYAGSFDEARQQFDAIARDHSSPWHDKGAYLAARSLLRKGSFAEKEEERTQALTEAETRLNAILKDKTLASSHAAAARLLNLVRLRLHPEEKLHELAHAIAGREGSPNFKQAVWDYTVLLDKFVGEDEKPDKTKLPKAVSADELSDWILTVQDQSAENANHAFERWQKTHGLVWLVAAMTSTTSAQPALDALLGAAAQVDHNSPAFASIAFHRVRLLMAAKRVDEARSVLDRYLADDRQNLSASALNLLLAERLSLSRNLDEFLQSAPRKPAGFSDNNDGREIPADENESKENTKGAELLFDQDAADVFNRAMPVSVMRDAARSRTLPANLRQDVAQATFVRAAIIDDREIALQAAGLLQAMHPELKEFLTAYQTATTPEARRFAAAYLSLKFPGLRPHVSYGVGRTTPIAEIDSYRDNWWCAEPPSSRSGAGSEGEGEEASKPKPVVPPLFLKPLQDLASRQYASLQASGVAPNYLCRITVEWTEKNPADRRAAEALHLAVKATRYGCTDKDTGRWSKAAFDSLHQHYPNSTWAKQTKYWFKG